MNSRQQKLSYIRYMNEMRKRGYKKPKWTLNNKYWPYMWINHSNEVLEEKFYIDLGFL